MNINKIAWLVVKIIFCCFLLIFIPLQTLACDPLHGHSTLIPKTWKPALDQISGYLEESAKPDVRASQQALNQNSQNLADIRDAQLFIVYIQLMQVLDTQDQAKLFEEQKHWLVKRVEYAEAAVISKGGSLAPLEYNSAFKKITEERLIELQKRLQQ